VAFSKIDLRNFRCFDSLSIDLSSKSSLFFGKNGCGKTSILESIYVASSGRSFRTSNLESLIKKGAEAFNIRAYDDSSGSVLEVKKAINNPINFIMIMPQNIEENSSIEVCLLLLQIMQKIGLDIFDL
jgi:DNA replication and repair protein RecF